MRSIEPERNSTQTWRSWRSRLSVAIGCILVLAAACIAGYDVGVEVSIHDEPGTAWWPAAVNLAIFCGGLAGSWILTGLTARRHTKSAFRRLRSVSIGLDKISEIARPDLSKDPERALDRIAEIAFTNRQSVQDALEDWADLAPQDVADLRSYRIDGQDEFLPTTPGAIASKGVGNV